MVPVALQRKFQCRSWYRDYHMVSDEPQYVAYNRMARIGQYIQDYVSEIAKLGHQPLVDKPKPDPYATCKQ